MAIPTGLFHVLLLVFPFSSGIGRLRGDAVQFGMVALEGTSSATAGRLDLILLDAPREHRRAETLPSLFERQIEFLVGVRSRTTPSTASRRTERENRWDFPWDFGRPSWDFGTLLFCSVPKRGSAMLAEVL
jgi:hypothetical protein